MQRLWRRLPVARPAASNDAVSFSSASVSSVADAHASAVSLANTASHVAAYSPTGISASAITSTAILPAIGPDRRAAVATAAARTARKE